MKMIFFLIYSLLYKYEISYMLVDYKLNLKCKLSTKSYEKQNKNYLNQIVFICKHEIKLSKF